MCANGPERLWARKGDPDKTLLVKIAGSIGWLAGWLVGFREGQLWQGLTGPYAEHRGRDYRTNCRGLLSPAALHQSLRSRSKLGIVLSLL